jgi:hypothetical protein
MLNKLKVMWDSTSIYTHWAPSSKKLFKKISTYMCPNSPMCNPCLFMWPMTKLKMN